MITIKTKDEIERIRECGIIAEALFDYLEMYIQSGITTKELDRISEAFIKKHGAIPSFKGYQDFPSSICASVNEEVIHGIPCNRKLKDGDIVGIDVGVLKNGMISDSALTYKVGMVSKENEELMKKTEIALYKGIAQVKEGNEINAIGGTIDTYVTKQGYHVIKEYCGHGVGYQNHEEPEVPNYKYKLGSRKLKEGMVIAIEPMTTFGSGKTYVLDDGWTVVTKENKMSAHYEHTVAVTKDGFDILTASPERIKKIREIFFQ